MTYPGIDMMDDARRGRLERMLLRGADIVDEDTARASRLWLDWHGSEPASDDMAATMADFDRRVVLRPAFDDAEARSALAEDLRACIASGWWSVVAILVGVLAGVEVVS